MTHALQKNTWFDVLCIAFVTLFALLCVLPLLLVIMISITDEQTLVINGYSFFPDKISFAAYGKIFTTNAQRASRYFLGNMVLHSYVVTIGATVLGTASALLITSCAAYALSNQNMKYRNALAFYFVVTMLINTGVVPWYLVNRSLGLRNVFWALVIPSLMFTPFNMMLVRNFMNGLPESLRESARIDGAGDMRICFQIVLPLSLPVLAAVTLFYGLGYWNNWFNAIMLVDQDTLYPLQYYLMVIKSQIAALNELKNMGISDTGIILPSESLKMATVVVTIGPIVLLYPMLQKYFIKGLVIGGVKG